MKKIYMCLPWHFDVQYVINPWMEGNYHRVDRRLAVEQWEGLRAALARAGAQVLTLGEPPSDCPDAVFIANAGLIFKNTFIPSYFKFMERAGEESFFAQEFSARRYKLANLHVTGPRAQQAFEGAGDALYDRTRKIMWLGFGFRTQRGFKPALEAALEQKGALVRSLELVDPRFYHLDTCFCPLDDGNLLWYPPAFSNRSQHTIRTSYPDAVSVYALDAYLFACNAVSIGKNLITPKISPGLANQLWVMGYNVEQVDMSQYLRSGGACKCLTIEALE